MSDWLNKKVRITKEIEEIPIGSIGICTADLPDDDVFAVWFDNIELEPPWGRFNYDMRDEYFELCECGE